MSSDTTRDPRYDLQGWRRALDRNIGVIARNVEGIDLDRSLLSAWPEGSHLNWLLGHLVTSRDGMLRLLGAEGVWDPETATAYRRGSSPALAPEARPIDELLAALRKTQELLEEALDGAGESVLSAASGDRTVGERVEFLVWHETYHVGQTAIYRRLAGLSSAIG